MAKTAREALEIHIENVRSFIGPTTIPVRPLTFLVGENSTGKSTFLAIMSAVLDRSITEIHEALNLAPYELGPFESIASRVQRGRQASFFTMGASVRERVQSETVRLSFSNEAGRLGVRTIEVANRWGQLSCHVNTSRATGHLVVFALDRSPALEEDFSVRLAPPAEPGDGPVWHVLRAIEAGLPHRAYPHPGLLAVVRPQARIPRPRLVSIAPIRSKPRRTYEDSLDLSFSPDGGHIPQLLSSVLLGRVRHSEWSPELLSSITEFGHESGLFSGVGVRRLGKRPDDPYQLMVSVGGLPTNVADVGYGVSQALPIVVQSAIEGRGSRLLLQQPEVHLHPRAQAALGSFFARLASSQNRQFVVETHSDYIIDRVRMEVAKGTIAAKDVSILYFEKPKRETRVTPIELDESGNLVDAPPGYREFFLEEQFNLLSRTR